MPQEAVNVKKIWSNLDKDIDNRWTGRGADGNGSQGLYMSGEFLEKNSPFPELEYYQQKELPVAAQKIVVAFYEKDKKVLFAVLLINNLPLLTFIPSNRMYQIENMPDGKKLINGDKYEVFQKILNLWESDDYQTLLNILENPKLWIVLNKDKDNYKITIQEIEQEFI